MLLWGTSAMHRFLSHFPVNLGWPVALQIFLLHLFLECASSWDKVWSVLNSSLLSSCTSFWVQHHRPSNKLCSWYTPRLDRIFVLPQWHHHAHLSAISNLSFPNRWSMLCHFRPFTSSFLQLPKDLPLQALILPPSVWPHLFCGAGHEKRRGEQLKWSLAFTLYIGNFPCAQLPGPVHTAWLGRVCFFYIFSLDLCFACSFVLFDLFVSPFFCVSLAVEWSPLQFLALAYLI